MYNGFIVKLGKLRKHENADRLQIANIFGNNVIVNLEAYEGQLGVYFPSDGQLSEEYCIANNLVRKKDENGKEVGGYMDPVKRNVKAIQLRGERSDGIFEPIESLLFCFRNQLAFDEFVVGIDEGTQITTVNGHEICRKYIPISKKDKEVSMGNKTRKHKVPFAPMFAEHADTTQLAYNVNQFCVGDIVELTLKMHGTSQRTGNLPILKGLKKNFLDYILFREGKPQYEYGYVTGTRRTVLENFSGGFYGSNSFRKIHHDKFVGKLYQGETVYYEVVGYTEDGGTIMGTGINKKVGKDFVRQYGDRTVFAYGCEEKESKCFVYRMTMTTPEGVVIEYTPDFMRYRCEQMGVNCVPEFECFIIPEMEEYKIGEYVINKVEQYYDGADPIGKTHVREGVVARIVNRPKFTAYKHKNFSFRILEGIIKENADAPDMEEAEELVKEN